jgi:hypothetical protein
VGSSGSCFPIRLLEQASGCLLYIGHGECVWRFR